MPTILLQFEQYRTSKADSENIDFRAERCEICASSRWSAIAFHFAAHWYSQRPGLRLGRAIAVQPQDHSQSSRSSRNAHSFQ